LVQFAFQSRNTLTEIAQNVSSDFAYLLDVRSVTGNRHDGLPTSSLRAATSEWYVTQLPWGAVEQQRQQRHDEEPSTTGLDYRKPTRQDGGGLLPYPSIAMVTKLK
jgi:hypothetical protein